MLKAFPHVIDIFHFLKACLEHFQFYGQMEFTEFALRKTSRNPEAMSQPSTVHRQPSSIPCIHWL